MVKEKAMGKEKYSPTLAGNDRRASQVSNPTKEITQNVA
jgi:hypothetical protein